MTSSTIKEVPQKHQRQPVDHTLYCIYPESSGCTNMIESHYSVLLLNNLSTVLSLLQVKPVCNGSLLFVNLKCMKFSCWLTGGLYSSQSRFDTIDVPSQFYQAATTVTPLSLQIPLTPHPSVSYIWGHQCAKVTTFVYSIAIPKFNLLPSVVCFAPSLVLHVSFPRPQIRSSTSALQPLNLFNPNSTFSQWVKISNKYFETDIQVHLRLLKFN